jgi:thioesterase domain-containing protein
MVINGSLKFNFFTKLDKRTTEEISQLFKQTLEQVIEYCICKDYTEYTMGDFNGFDPYIILHRTVKNNNRLFLFPPGGGGAESYLRNITLKLQEIELVVFNNYYDYLKNNDQGYLLQLMTYEKLASNYISYIKTIQTKGPYHLFGWSFGGVLAFEIARQLIHIGDNVENILIVDSFFNYKKAVIETNTGTTEELSNINYKYLPGQNIDMDCSNIILFKAIRLADNFDKISEYYTKNTIYNNLDTILKNNSKIKIVDVNDDHNSWIDNKFEVIKVSNTILSIFRNK